MAKDTEEATYEWEFRTGLGGPDRNQEVLEIGTAEMGKVEMMGNQAQYLIELDAPDNHDDKVVREAVRRLKDILETAEYRVKNDNEWTLRIYCEYPDTQDGERTKEGTISGGATVVNGKLHNIFFQGNAAQVQELIEHIYPRMHAVHHQELRRYSGQKTGLTPRKVRREREDRKEEQEEQKNQQRWDPQQHHADPQERPRRSRSREGHPRQSNARVQPQQKKAWTPTAKGTQMRGGYQPKWEPKARSEGALNGTGAKWEPQRESSQERWSWTAGTTKWGKRWEERW